MSVGNGNESQIHLFSAQNGWDFLEVAFVMDHPDGFLDSIAFWDKLNGLAYGDSFDGKPYILKTEDGGKYQIFELFISADHHFEYPRADFIRVRLNNFELNGGILKAIGLKLAKRDRVKVGL